MPANLEISAVATWLENVSFHSSPQKGKCQTRSRYHTIALVSLDSKVMFKILQVRLQRYMNWELTEVQAGFQRSRVSRDQIASIHWIMEKAKEFQKNTYFCFIDYTKAFDCVDHKKTEKFLNRWGYQTTLPVSWKTCILVKKQNLNWTWNN